MMYWPSVAGVEFACDAMTWRAVCGTPSFATRSHRILPVALSSAYTRHEWGTSSLVYAEAPPPSSSPPRPCWNTSFESLRLTAVVTYTRSPQITGLEWAKPVIGVFHLMLTPFSTFHTVGGWSPSPFPELAGPRNDGHSRIRGGSAALAVGVEAEAAG